jgi:hypothetical protein
MVLLKKLDEKQYQYLSAILLLLFIVAMMIIIIINITKLQMNKQDINMKNKIIITPELFDKMVDIVTDYSMLKEKNDEKILLVYLSTFHLFDMNYSYEKIKILDDSLKNELYVSPSITLPQGNHHHNIQKVIISQIEQYISHKNNCKLVHDYNNDKSIVRKYLKELFTSMNILHQ